MSVHFSKESQVEVRLFFLFLFKLYFYNNKRGIFYEMYASFGKMYEMFIFLFLNKHLRNTFF